MKHIISREEYLQMNEGIFRDTIVKGFNKLKSFLSISIKKVKGFIVAFFDNGTPMPVITPNALIDHYSNVNGVKIFAPKEMSDSTVSAGGRGCKSVASYEGDDEIYTFYPKFSSKSEFCEWMKNGGYKEIPEYKNLKKILSLSKNESKKNNGGNELNEDLNDLFAHRVSYSHDSSLGDDGEMNKADTEVFKELIYERIDYIRGKRKRKPENLLIFGAPGIGKSTIPRDICEAYNEGKEPSDKICLLVVDTPTISEGDLMMPAMPDKSTLGDELRKGLHSDTEIKNKLSQYKTILNKTYPEKVSYNPISWLPVYKPTGIEEVDEMLDEIANSGVQRKKNGKYEKTGGGGILFFDEFLRGKEGIFNNIMNLVFDSMNGWVLGSKWVIIAATNRPADSRFVRGVWEEFENESAWRDRFRAKFEFTPNPESWKEWAKDKIFADSIILDYIFGKKIGDEYPRWHTVLDPENPGKSKQPNIISPRNWESAICSINEYVDDHKDLGYVDVTSLSKKEIIRCCRESFSDEFCEDLADYIIEHASIEIDKIIENPREIKPKKNPKTDDVNIIRSIHEEVMKQKEGGREFTDDELKNIVLWFGLNFPTMGNSVENDFLQHLDKLVPTSEVLKKFHETCIMFNAAYPSKEVIKFAEEDKEFADYIQIDKIKSICEEYFENRIKNGELVPVNDWDDEEEKEEK